MYILEKVESFPSKTDDEARIFTTAISIQHCFRHTNQYNKKKGGGEAEGVTGAQRGPLGSEREVVLVSEAVNGTRPVLSDVLGTAQ